MTELDTAAMFGAALKKAKGMDPRFVKMVSRLADALRFEFGWEHFHMQKLAREHCDLGPAEFEAIMLECEHWSSK
jgi:hypothetical protein